MTFNTKYSIGDKVWFLGNGFIAEDIITGISTDTRENGVTSVIYYFQNHECKHETSLFESKEALIQSL